MNVRKKLGSPESGCRDVLIVLAGKPGTGKTTVGRLLAGRLRAAYLRTDVIAGPMLVNGLTEDKARAGRVAYGIASEVATENLRAGLPVLVDGVHATRELRARWRTICEATDCRLVQLEMTLADKAEHRRRVENRQIDGHPGPTWEQIQDMPYDVWNEAIDGRRLVVDGFDVDAALARCIAYVEDCVSA